jgi:flagellum-specific peptidoglycan hydrolase FlgJ
MRTLSILLSILLSSYNAVELEQVTQNQKVAYYINTIIEDAIRVHKSTGVPLELILAQCCLESGYGTSSLSTQKCNHLGIRPGGSYARFNSISDCLDRYARVMQQPCYKNLQPVTLDQWICALECCHYASSEDYRWKLNWIIDRFGLKLL